MIDTIGYTLGHLMVSLMIAGLLYIMFWQPKGGDGGKRGGGW